MFSQGYRQPAELVSITNDNELIFNFIPQEKNVIPRKVSMGVNITLSRFGSSVYYFHVEPGKISSNFRTNKRKKFLFSILLLVHATNVNFKIENILHNQFSILITHNHTGTKSERLCLGDISQIDDQSSFTKVNIRNLLLVEGLYEKIFIGYY